MEGRSWSSCLTVLGVASIKNKKVFLFGSNKINYEVLRLSLKMVKEKEKVGSKVVEMAKREGNASFSDSPKS